ncbi:NAD(P)H-dependent oxidoreductase [Hyphomonas sp.]|uniref:NADPH-dependent FMN reductase n=1 Tax=Hyphomonas sp. TaxID=87 RepID=UPI0032D9A511
MPAVKLLAFSGSSREESFNQRLLDHAVHAAQDSGAEIEAIRLADFNLPLYSQNLELNAFPEDAKRLKELFRTHHGFLIASPEHNGSITTLLKNAIDWVSRPTDGEAALALTGFRGKVAGLMSTSPSPFGGLRSLSHLRQILTTIQTLVVTEQVSVPLAHTAFDGPELLDTMPKQLLPPLVNRVIQLAKVSA